MATITSEKTDDIQIDIHEATTRMDEELRSSNLQRRINALRDVNNVTNWYYIAREYLYFSCVLGPALVFFHFYSTWGISWLWNVPVSCLAIFLVGLGQHRLVMLAHEASHYLLFKDTRLNEIASNWFCLYPMWSMTYNYRLQHLAHHQYTNDPLRDPDLIYMKASGHNFYYPMPLSKFFFDCVIKLFFWIPGLVQYIIIRAKFANLGGITGPYMPQEKPSRLIPAVHLTYMVSIIVFLGLAETLEWFWVLALAPLVFLGALLVFTLTVPERMYMRTAVKPVLSPRWALYQRLVFITVLFTTLSWAEYFTGRPWALYYVILWVVPLITVFSFFMILREDIQHSNTESEKFRDTRNFQGNSLIKWSLFPLNMDYHLPHHLFPLVPHYNLPKLDRILQETKVYRENTTVVEGHLFPHGSKHSADATS